MLGLSRRFQDRIEGSMILHSYCNCVKYSSQSIVTFIQEEQNKVHYVGSYILASPLEMNERLHCLRTYESVR
jgi:hypothetical protein